MTGAQLSAAICLGLGSAVVLLSCVGVAVMSGPFDRLHFLSLASTLPPLAIAAAVLIDNPGVEADIKVVLIALLLLLIGPVVTHMTARAARVRREGSLKVPEAGGGGP
jgi:multisubunit Na+/H+ antiporter MnhG subunit